MLELLLPVVLEITWPRNHRKRLAPIGSTSRLRIHIGAAKRITRYEQAHCRVPEYLADFRPGWQEIQLPLNAQNLTRMSDAGYPRLSLPTPADVRGFASQ